MQTDQVFLKASVVLWVDDHFPGFAECRFRDRFDREWVVVDKVPVLTHLPLHAASQFPQHVFLACTVIAQDKDALGRPVAKVEARWVESVDGVSVFEVFADQLAAIDLTAPVEKGGAEQVRANPDAA